MRAFISIVAIAFAVVLTGCHKPESERYIATRTDLDPKTKEAILKHRIILGMYPDEAAAAGGEFFYEVHADKARWGETYDPWEVIFSERTHPDNSELKLTFHTRTQFDTILPVAFTVVFTNGTAVSITKNSK
jgi:hypothetical protein